MPAAVKPPRTLYDKIWDDHVVYVTLLLVCSRASLTQASEGMNPMMALPCCISTGKKLLPLPPPYSPD